MSGRYRREEDDYNDTQVVREVDNSKSVEIDKMEVERNNSIQGEHWVKAYWRPAMGWLYMIICFVDFVLFPFMAMVMPVVLKNLGFQETAYVAWESLSLSNGGIIHLAFAAILGVTAWTRGMEKLKRD